MKVLLALFMLLPLTGQTQSLEDFLWRSRLIVVFTPTAEDPLFIEQYRLLMDAVEPLRERQVQVILVTPGGDLENSGIFLQEAESDYYYDYFSAKPYQLELSLVGFDGNEKFRAKNSVTPVSVLTELIDSMPMRQRELRRGYGNKSNINRKSSVIPSEEEGGGG